VHEIDVEIDEQPPQEAKTLERAATVNAVDYHAGLGDLGGPALGNLVEVHDDGVDAVLSQVRDQHGGGAFGAPATKAG